MRKNGRRTVISMIKIRTCKFCRQKSTETVKTPVGYFCTYGHAALWARRKAQEAAERRSKAKARTAKEKLKTRRQRMKEAQAAFNRFVRVRDQLKPCISSGQPLARAGVGGGFDCGHYRSVGAAGHLRFNLFNAHGQRKHDNRWLSGNAVDYRLGLIARIGLERVERLEADNRPRRFDSEYLERVKRIFSRRARLYERLFR